MAIKLNSNFDYRGSNPNFERDVVETFEELKNLSGYPDGHLVYCKETKLHYKYNEELESGETGKFEEFKTGGIEIVNSVEELDPDAEQGSLASVAVNTMGEVSFSELYQATSDDEFNVGTGVINTTNLSRVNSISINSSYDTSAEIHDFYIYLLSKDYNGQERVGQAVVLFPGVSITVNLSTQEQNQLELFTPNEDGTITVNEENLAIINNLLSSTEFFYGLVLDDSGLVDPSYADVYYKCISGVQKTDLYIKDVEGWVLYKDTISFPQIEIVDDLNTGGNDKALSAEMGKVLAENVGVIVDSEEELPSTSLIGARASVNVNRITGEKEVNVDKIHEENTFLHRVVLRSSILYTPAVAGFTLELEAEDGTRIKILISAPYKYDSSRWGALVWGFSDNMPNSNSDRSQTICEYAALSAPTSYAVLDPNTEALSKLNNELSSRNYRIISGYSVGSYGVAVPNVFLMTYVAEVQKAAKIYVRNEAGWEQYSELVDNSVTTNKVADSAITVEKISDSSVTLEKLSTDVQDKFTAIESQLTSKSTSIDFGMNEDTTTLAIMDPSVITKIKTMNVSNLYISYGDVVKQEIDLSLSEQNIDLGDADFIVINITRTTAEIDAALGLTFINKTV